GDSGKALKSGERGDTMSYSRGAPSPADVMHSELEGRPADADATCTGPHRRRRRRSGEVPRDTPLTHSYISVMTSDVHERTDALWGASAAPMDWEAVYAEQLPRVYNYFRYRMGNEAVAEDLTSRTFEKAWRERNRYRQDFAGAATWLLRIARNTGVDHLRTLHEHEPLEEAADAPAEGTPEEEAVVHSNFVRLTALVSALPDREREL